MAKYSGMIGFKGVETETEPGIWTVEDVERNYRGDLMSLSSSAVPSAQINEGVTLNQRISIIADKFSFENFTRIQYITYMGVKWKVEKVAVDRPRLTLNIGGVFNG